MTASYAVNPTVTIAAAPRTRVTFGYEHLHDTRVADRGLTSFQGRPADVDVSAAGLPYTTRSMAKLL